MSTWDERFLNHPVHEALSRLEQLLNETRGIAETEPQTFERWERVAHNARYARQKIDTTDRSLVNPTNLDNCKRVLDKIVSFLVNFQNDKNSKHLAAANSSLDAENYHFFSLPTFETIGDISIVNAAAESYEQRTNNIIQTFSDKLKKFITDGNDSLSHIKSIDALMSNKAQASDYKKVADEGQHAAKLWTYAAVGTLALWFSINFCIYFFSHIDKIGFFGFSITFNSDSNTANVFRQLLFTTPLLLFSGFAALQVSINQRTERNNRRTEIELTTLKPYLDELPDNVKNDVKRALAEKFFGQREVDLHKTEANPSLSFLLDIAKSIRPTSNTNTPH